jgi:hypothetical protein
VMKPTTGRAGASTQAAPLSRLGSAGEIPRLNETIAVGGVAPEARTSRFGSEVDCSPGLAGSV